jgi:hypothetical protein
MRRGSSSRAGYDPCVLPLNDDDLRTMRDAERAGEARATDRKLGGALIVSVEAEHLPRYTVMPTVSRRLTLFAPLMLRRIQLTVMVAMHLYAEH